MPTRLKSFPFLIVLLSIGGISLLTMLTSPLDNILFAVIFFCLILILLIALGYVIAGASSRKTRQDRRSLAILSVFIVLMLMFSSIQSLNWITALTLLFLAYGAIFYDRRRS